VKNLTKYLVIVAVVLVAASTLTLAGDDKWFDMENCGFCKQLMDPPDMLEHATWEHHNIANGIVSVATIDKKYIGPWRAAEAKMEEMGKKMEKGEQVPMCNACMAMGKLMMMGAKWESVTTTHGSVSLMTSDDPATVKEIQAWGKRTMDEMAKMEKMEKEHDHGEHGHDHDH
jgi:hypothetical protein